MQELEKILEEIDETINRYGENPELITEDITDFCYGLNVAKCIIRRHMNDGWIQVDDRLPKTNGTYNVTRHIDGHFISDSAYFDGQNTWHSDNRVNHSRPYLTDVIAWCPLPEPYRYRAEHEGLMKIGEALLEGIDDSEREMEATLNEDN